MRDVCGGSLKLNGEGKYLELQIPPWVRGPKMKNGVLPGPVFGSLIRWFAGSFGVRPRRKGEWYSR